ncbi:UDP-N-acetylmuramoyl-L-alanyl-D-glutamate--2,6-diaminopimelate ligase [Vulgatibacter sp.]|uniref:UDP-N-acetylmuramoyl-L-alanyl-D-glutamate--2, 6-diaminopimelate ligase n=1 Tax=Vulgatibacter sp. TaxID=1971226 RepID=UPI003568FDE6
MRLSHVIAGTGLALPAGSPDPEITAVVHDSRKVIPGALFVCLPGLKVDGHAFAAGAVAAGAAAVIGERSLDLAVPALVVPSARAALARAAANLHGNPGERLALAGITGTNGKTTTTWLYEAIALAAGKRCGVIGTVNYRFAGKVLPAEHTTPEAVEVQALLAGMVDAGCETAVMEVSSHALAQDRVLGLTFATAAFTNLTHDHLDYHADMEDYFAAKAKLFRAHLRAGGVAVLNGDDAYGTRLHEELVAGGVTSWRFSTEDAAAELTARDVRIGIDGIEATLVTPRGEAQIRSPLVGAHNLQNLLTAAGLALGAGLPIEAVAEGLTQSPGAPGRLERIDGPQGVVAFVDYAHTDDALRRACSALREASPGRLITVFGCGGDRDTGKRPLMGAVAGSGSDLAVVTSDNPRTEDPARIVEMIVPGVECTGKKRLSHDEARAGGEGFTVEVDRRKAIDLAVACARPGDVILIAGKGHEDYQILGTTKIHFDDREEARRALGA